METLQKKVFNIIRDDQDDKTAGKVFDIVLIVLIVSTVVFLILDSFPMMPFWYDTLSSYFEVFSVVIFSIEYLLRVWTAPYMYPGKTPARARLTYMFSFMALVDFVSIVPFYLPFVFRVDLRVLRVLRLFRLFRIFKFSRYTYALSTILLVFKRRASQLVSSLFIIAILMVVCSILLYNVENEAQPEIFQNALSGIWWALSVVTGAWYGDIFPITLAGRMMGAAMALLSVCLVAVPTGIVSAGFIDAFKAEKREWSDADTDFYLQIASEVAREAQKHEAGELSDEALSKAVQKTLEDAYS